MTNIFAQIRDMIEIFVNRAEIMSPATGAELRTQKQQNKLQIDRDKAPGGPGLFRGIFSTKVLYGVKDPEDGVIRCPNCNWEVHAGRCENPDCGVRVRQARDGDGYDSEESDGSGSETEEGSEPETDGGIEMPMRWAESIVGETEDDWEDAVDEEDADGFDDVDDVSSRRRNRNLYGAAVMNRNGTVGPGYDDSEEDDESDSDGTVGSLRDFVADDSPEVRRPVRRPGTGGPWALPSSSPYASSPARQPIPQARRQNARPVIADDDDDDEESSTSSAPARRSNRRFQNARHVSLSSDYEDDEQSLLGYQALIGNQTDHTATEDEDDGVSSPPVRAMGGRRNIGQRTAGPGSVFSVPEEDDEDEFADADESEDQDGDITMGDTPPRRITGGNTATGATRPSTRRPSNGRDQTGTRIQAGSSRNQPIELDSASESEVALSRRRTRRSAPASNGPRNSSYFTNHQRNSSGSGRGNRRATSEVNPTLMGLFAQHGQQLRETQFNSLGRNSSSVSPARTLTPVQRAMSGRRSSAGSRGSTPLRAMYSSPPPPFSPMQSPELTSGPSGISPSSPPAQSPTSNNNNNPWLRSFSLSPRLGSSGNSGQSWGILSALQNQPQRIASPMGVRVRSRASNARLRGNGSRNGYRANSATPSTPHAVSFAGGASIAGVMGRAMAQPAQQAQRPQQHVQHQHVQHVQHQHQPHQNQQQQQQQQQQAHRQQQPLPQPVPQVQNQQVQQQTSQPPPIQQHTRPQPQPQQRTQQQQQQQGGVRLGGGSNSGGSPRVLTAEDIRARGEQIRQNQLRMINGGGPLQQMRE